ncbi:hypothetical protein [Leptospira sarikeiensis]|uniref:Uncharacterized protein n=1 Tax=Leptospira sarikeiensis TaxID=2484943 RepID=A0A4R9K342_9LEPT|nr:hypothetical protein [Leptospira sarikeiensis]TGL58728.1 hypothetical protein EHQ64_16890 [Leptospira sarikeiensis]
MEHLKEIIELGPGIIVQVQSTFILVKSSNPSESVMYKIHSKKKIDSRVIRGATFENIYYYDEHLINLERREDSFQIYFMAEDDDSLISLINFSIKCIEDIYSAYRSPEYFMNDYFLNYTKRNTGPIFGLICEVPETVLKLIESKHIEGIKLSKLSSRKYESAGKVLMLDDMFIWAQDFRSERIFN